MADLKSDGKDIRENYISTFEPLPKQDPDQPNVYYPVMVPPMPLSKFIDKIDWVSVNELKKSNKRKETNSGVPKYCEELKKSRYGYEAEVMVFRVLERMKQQDEITVLHGLEYLHSDYQMFVREFSESEKKGKKKRKRENITGECDFIVMGKYSFVIIEVKKNTADLEHAKLQASRTEKLILGIAKRLGSAVPTILKFVAFPYEKSKYEGIITKVDIESDDSFSSWWKTNVTEELLMDQQSPVSFEETKNVLLALWANKNNICQKNLCSLGRNIRDIDTKLKTAIITFEKKGVRNDNSNPGVVEAPPEVRDNIGIKYLTAEQDKKLKSKEKLLWINGPAGSGKTVVLCGKILELALSDKKNKIVVFTFTGEGNNANLYQTALSKAGVLCKTITNNIGTLYESGEINDVKEHYQVVIVKIERFLFMAGGDNFTELVESQTDSSVFIDDMQAVMYEYTFSSIRWTDDSFSKLLDAFIKLSCVHHVWVVCDLAQIYIYRNYIEIKHSEGLIKLTAILEEKFNVQRVTLPKNLRNTQDISTVLSVVRNVYAGIEGREFGYILPKQEHGHFIRGPLTKIHVLEDIDYTLMKDILVNEFKMLLKADDLDYSDIGILFTYSKLKQFIVETLSSEGYDTNKISICYSRGSCSSEWPAVIVLHNLWFGTSLGDLSGLYTAISRARVKCFVVLFNCSDSRTGNIHALLDLLKPIAHVIRH